MNYEQERPITMNTMAQILGISIRAVINLTRKGDLPQPEKVGDTWVFPKAETYKYLIARGWTPKRPRKRFQADVWGKKSRQGTDQHPGSVTS